MSTDTPLDGPALRRMLRDLSQREGSARPDLVVMTTETCERLIDARRTGLPRTPPPNSSGISCFGIPVEHYPTVRECMDRLVERGFQIKTAALILDRPVPEDLKGHPFMVGQSAGSALLGWLEKTFGFTGGNPA